MAKKGKRKTEQPRNMDGTFAKKKNLPATRMEKRKVRPTAIKPGQKLNPTGKGGFQDHPELRSNGRWSKETSFRYWLSYFKTLPLKEFSQYKNRNPNICMAALAAWARVAKAIEKLEEFKEVANRTEGMPTQRTELTGKEGVPLVFDVQLRRINDNSDNDKTAG